MPHSLLSDSESIGSEDNALTMIISSRIFIEPHQPIPRIPKKEFRELVAAIRSEPDSHPLTLQRVEGSSAFRLLSEEKYLRAYLYCATQKIPCIIQDPPAASRIRVLPKNYFEEADLIHKLYTEENVSEEEISSFFQASPERCREKMLLHNFKETERKIILKSRISIDAVICLHHLNKKEKYTVYRAMVNEGIYGKEAEEMILRLSHSKAKILIKSIGLFYNSIDKAIKTMNQSGIPVRMTREENTSHTCITIMIPNTEKPDPLDSASCKSPQLFHAEH